MDWQMLVPVCAMALVLLGAICYPLGWKGSVLWLLACGLVTLVVGPYKNTGGCDGGLCIFGYLLFHLRITYLGGVVVRDTAD